VPAVATGTWLDVGEDSPFGVDNLPYGVVEWPGHQHPRVAVPIGAAVLDLAGALERISGDLAFLVRGPSLDHLLREGPEAWQEMRATLVHLLTDDRHREVVEPALLARDRVRPVLPFTVADYVDFYSSEQHATNVGRILRPDSPALPANWKHLPIGYHGRSGTVTVSGTDVVRPSGQRKPAGSDSPTYGPSQRLDIEAEVGFVVGTPSTLGTPVPVADWRQHVFGVVLVNDWSARDIQAWEYQPLGPFLGKSFLTSVSPWVVPLAALEDAFVEPPRQDPPPLDYLRPAGPGLALDLEVRLNGQVVSRPPAAALYWTPAQQLAHLTANGASLRTGDLYASGTVSGDSREQRGSLLELTWNGTEPVTLPDGGTRGFLADGDTVSISATAPGPDGTRIGFGEVTGRVIPGAGPRAPGAAGVNPWST
jgi:fumarylacetoacetase